MGRGCSRLWRQNCLEVSPQWRAVIVRFCGMEVDENSASGRYENEGKARRISFALSLSNKIKFFACAAGGLERLDFLRKLMFWDSAVTFSSGLFIRFIKLIVLLSLRFSEAIGKPPRPTVHIPFVLEGVTFRIRREAARKGGPTGAERCYRHTSFPTIVSRKSSRKAWPF